jgi:hypothetical protein
MITVAVSVYSIICLSFIKATDSARQTKPPIRGISTGGIPDGIEAKDKPKYKPSKSIYPAISEIQPIMKSVHTVTVAMPLKICGIETSFSFKINYISVQMSKTKSNIVNHNIFLNAISVLNYEFKKGQSLRHCYKWHYKGA